MMAIHNVQHRIMSKTLSLQLPMYDNKTWEAIHTNIKCVIIGVIWSDEGYLRGELGYTQFNRSSVRADCLISYCQVLSSSQLPMYDNKINNKQRGEDKSDELHPLCRYSQQHTRDHTITRCVI